MTTSDTTRSQPPPIRLNIADIGYKTTIKFIVPKLNALLAVIGADTIHNLLPFKWFSFPWDRLAFFLLSQTVASAQVPFPSFQDKFVW